MGAASGRVGFAVVKAYAQTHKLVPNFSVFRLWKNERRITLHMNYLVSGILHVFWVL